MRNGKRVAILATVVLMGLTAVWCKVLVYGGEPDKNAKYIGSKKCRSCHTKEYKTWKATKHSKTFDQLEGPEKKDPDCLKCHTTAYGQPSGFVSEEQSADLENTGCEACHGPGSAHADAAKDAPEEGKWDTKYPKVVKTGCTNCHNPHVPQKERVEAMRAERKKKAG